MINFNLFVLVFCMYFNISHSTERNIMNTPKQNTENDAVMTDYQLDFGWDSESLSALDKLSWQLRHDLVKQEIEEPSCIPIAYEFMSHLIGMISCSSYYSKNGKVELLKSDIIGVFEQALDQIKDE